MTPGGAEALKAAIRRAIPLAVVLVALGVVSLTALRQYQGARYEASARVLISDLNLGALVTGVQLPYVDPQRIEDQELSLASSDELYRRTAERNPSLGDADEISEMVSVSGENGIFVFTAADPDGEVALETANAVANEFIRWRAELTGEEVRRAQGQLRSRIADEDSPQLRQELQQQLNDLELLETLSAGSARLFEEADEARKTSPAPVRDSILGGAIGLIVAVLIVGVREALSTRVRSESDVEELLDLPVLASVPTFPRRAKLVLFGRHEHMFADTFALLAASVMRARDGAEHTTLAVTSAIANEGKTLTASNLAVALARRGARVVLVDLDTRKPSIGPLFRIPAQSPGVVQAIAGTAPVSAALWQVSLNGAARARRPVPETTAATAAAPPTNGSGDGSLQVIAAGGAVQTGAVVQSKRLPELFDELREHADIVVVDTPPALQTVEMAELSRVVDSVLLVVRHGQATHRSLRVLHRQVESWPATLIGAVMTDADLPDHMPYYTR